MQPEEMRKQNEQAACTKMFMAVLSILMKGNNIPERLLNGQNGICKVNYGPSL